MKDLNVLLKTYSGRKVLMAVMPHPDDETMATGGLILTAKKFGWKVVVLTLTKGESGLIFVHGKGRSIKKIRADELKKSVSILGIDKLILKDLGDGKLKENQKMVEAEVKKELEKVRPSIVVTYDHSGGSAHPDHIITSLVTKKVLKTLKTAKYSPILLWTSRPKEMLKKRQFFRQQKEIYCEPEYILDVKPFILNKWLSVRAHKSQGLGKFSYLKYLLSNPYEWYHEVNLKKNYRYKFVNYLIN